MRCGRDTLKVCVVRAHNLVKWDSARRELRIMYRTCLALQVDIVCGIGHQAWYFLPRKHKAERTDPTGEGHPEPLNGLLNAVARFEVARLNRDQLVYNRVAMEYVGNNAYETKASPEAVD